MSITLTPPPIARRRLILASALAPIAPAFAQEAWPGRRVVKMIVPSNPGSPTDLYSRLFAEHLSRSTGGTFIVENKPGAAGSIASTTLATAPADGSAFLMGSNSTFILTPLLQKPTGYNPARDLVPVGMLTSYPLVLLLRNGLPFTDVAGLVQHAKTRPSVMNAASFGVGSLGYLTNEHFCLLAGIKATHITYAGSPLVVQALAKGEADFGFESYQTARPMIEAGRLVPIGITSPSRSKRLPAVPTMAELGFAPVDTRIWIGLVTNSKTPADVIGKMNAELANFLKLPETQQQLEATSSDPTPESPSEMAGRFAKERASLVSLIKDAKIVME